LLRALSAWTVSLSGSLKDLQISSLSSSPSDERLDRIEAEIGK